MSSEPRTASHRKGLASLRLKTGEEESRLLAPALSCTGGFCLFRLFVWQLLDLVLVKGGNFEKDMFEYAGPQSVLCRRAPPTLLGRSRRHLRPGLLATCSWPDLHFPLSSHGP